VQILFDRGARKGIYLLLAVVQGHIGMVDIFISRGADIVLRNVAGLTPLACAAGKGKVDMAKWLLKKGADVNLRRGNLDRETYYYCSVCDGEDDFDLCQEYLD
jgi:hypothetical protein